MESIRNTIETLASKSVKNTVRDFWIGMAEKSRRKLKDGDYRDENGLAICGVCGKPMEERRMTKLEDGEGLDLIFGVWCDCDRAEDEKRKAEQKEREAKRIANSMRESSLMDKRLMDARFETSEVNAENEKQFKIAQRYVNKWETIEKVNQGILFWGLPGTGKSHLAACIANALIDKGVRTIMTSCIRLTDLILNSEVGETEILGRINRARLLILDDVGTERLTEYSIERIYSIVDSRYRACKPLIVTTNLTLDEMKSGDDLQMGRIYSRILEMCYPIKCTGKGFRRKATAERYAMAKKLLEED